MEKYRFVVLDREFSYCPIRLVSNNELFLIDPKTGNVKENPLRKLSTPEEVLSSKPTELFEKIF